MSEQEAKQAVQLPKSTMERIEARLPYTEFDAVDEYLEFIVEGVLHDVEESAEHEGEAVDESVVQDRLKSLGYLNE